MRAASSAAPSYIALLFLKTDQSKLLWRAGIVRLENDESALFGLHSSVESLLGGVK